MKRNELDRLIDDCLESCLSENDAAALSAELEASAEARARYWEAAAIHGLLDQAMHQSSLQVITGEGRPQRENFIPWRAVAAAALVVMGIGIAWWTIVRNESSNVPVATVLYAEGCEWMMPNEIAEGERLAPQRFHLSKGMALVRFDGGAEMMMRGETEWELISATEAKLALGDVSVRAEGDAAGFVLETPSASLLDLGTEFTVKVDDSKATELHVTEGEVAYEQDGETTVLAAGKSVRLERSQQPKSIASRAQNFGELLRSANPSEKPELMMVYHGFQYDEGNYAPDQINSGKGWAGSWRTPRDRQMHIVQGQPEIPWRMNRGNVGMLEMPAGGYVCSRPMAQPLRMNEKGITYFSFITQKSLLDADGKSTSSDRLRFTISSRAKPKNNFLSFGYGANQQPYVSASSFGTERSLSQISEGQNLLWIGKIIRSPEGGDELYFRIFGQDAELDFVEPQTWHVNFHRIKMDGELDLLTIASHGSSSIMVDEIRMGSTWRSVVPVSVFRKSTP